MAEERREFTLKNLRKALLGVARDTARTLASHGQPLFVLRDGEVVALDPERVRQNRPQRKAGRA